MKLKLKAEKLFNDCCLELKELNNGKIHYTHPIIAKKVITSSIDDLLNELFEKDNQYYEWLEIKQHIKKL